MLRQQSTAPNNFFHYTDDDALQPPLRPHSREDATHPHRRQQQQHQSGSTAKQSTLGGGRHTASATSLSNRTGLFGTSPSAAGALTRSISSRELRGPSPPPPAPTPSFGGYTILGGGSVTTTGIQQPPMCFTAQSSLAPFSPDSATFSVTNLPHSHAGVSLLKMHALPQVRRCTKFPLKCSFHI